MKRGTSARNGLAARCWSTGRPRFAEPMSEAPSPTQGRDENAPVLPSSASKLGVDGEGDTHHYSAYHGRLWVVRAGETLTMDLDGEQLAQWVDYVDEKHGWAELHWSDGSVVATLSAGVEVGR